MKNLLKTGITSPESQPGNDQTTATERFERIMKGICPEEKRVVVPFVKVSFDTIGKWFKGW